MTGVGRAEPKHRAERREVSGFLAHGVLAYVRRTLGEGVTAQVARRAGVADLLDDADRTARWLSSAEMLALAATAAEACGELDIGRRTGEELFHNGNELGVGELILEAGTIVDAVTAMTMNASKMARGRPLGVVAFGDSWLTIEGRFIEPGSRDPFYCSIVSGYYALVPSLFGALGRVVEPSCQNRGDDVCRFELTWTPDARSTLHRSDPDDAAVAQRNERTLARFEQLQATAADLVRSGDVDEALARICERASVALDAPRFLLAVEPDEHGCRRIHHLGFDSDESATRAADALRDGRYTEKDGALVASIASARHHYGILAALYSRGVTFFDREHRHLEAYAGHAAAALDVITSLDEARRDRDAARGLLELAAQLANVATPDEIAIRLAASIPAVARPDVASVWLWDAEREELVCAARHDTADPDGTGPVQRAITAADLPEIVDLVRDPRPTLFDAADARGWLGPMLAEQGIEAGAAVPIITNGRLHGAAVAAFRRALDREQGADLLNRLNGLAYHAAAALDNARLVEEMRHQALHDSLTGLPNRPLINERAAKVLVDAAADGSTPSILFIDLDRFKNVNDTLGHRAGDDLIRHVAHRIQGVLRAGDTLARLGGDEFLVLLPAVDDVAHATRVAARIVDAFELPFLLDGEELFVSCSIGIACAPMHGTDLASLMRHADSAMYTAKARGRRTFALDPTGPEPHRRQQLELETALHKALFNDEIRVLYQPQVDLTSMAIVGVEALMRWDHPTLGTLAPGSFLPMAEESGLIVGLDAWVRDQAFAQGARWFEAGRELTIAVNLSTRDLHDPELADRLRDAIDASRLPARLVELEVTDLVVMDEAVLPAVLQRLQALGARLAIDDFGTGSSVLRRLHHCPLDTLKIDRSFIAAIDTAEGSDAPLVRSLIGLARNLELKVVAEGVETDRQLEILREHGCDVGQGFLLGRPMDAAQLTALLDERDGRAVSARSASRA